MAPSSPNDDDLSARIAAAQARQADKVKPRANMSAASGYGVGMKMVLDLVSGAVVGLIFGLAVDHVLGTRPWGLIILIMLGMAAGFRLMLRTADSHAKRYAEKSNAVSEGSDSAIKGQEE